MAPKPKTTAGPSTPSKKRGGKISGSPKPATPKSSKTPVTAKDPAMSEAQIRAKKETAIGSNPPHVYVVDINLESNTSMLAGYLGMKDTSVLRELLTESVTSSKVIRPFYQARQAGFGIPGKNHSTKWEQRHIFKYIQENTVPLDSFLELPLPLPGVEPFVGMTRGYATWISTMHQIIIRNVRFFPDEEIPETEATPKYSGHSAEDWNRSYMLLKRFIRLQSSSSRGEGPNRNQTNAAISPHYLTPKERGEQALDGPLPDIMVAASADETLLKTIVNNASAEALGVDEATQQAWLDRDAGFDEDQGKENEAAFDAFQTKFAKVQYHQASTRLFSLADDTSRPPMNYETQMKVMTDIANKARVLYPPRRPDGRWTPTTDQMTLEASNLLANQGGRNDEDLAMEDITQRAENEAALGPADLVTEEIRQEHWSLQENLNRVTANAPSYADACQMLHLDPEQPALPSRPIGSVGAKGKQRETGQPLEKTLKPHQVVFIAWALTMEMNGMKGFLLGDDMGLGKTIAALSFLVFTARQAGADTVSVVESVTEPENPNDSMLPPDNLPPAGAPAAADTAAESAAAAGPKSSADSLGGTSAAAGPMLSADSIGGNSAAAAPKLSTDNIGETPAAAGAAVTEDDSAEHNDHDDALAAEINRSTTPDVDTTDADITREAGRETYAHMTAYSKEKAKIRAADALVSKIRERRYLPTLCVSPSQAAGVWKTEVVKNFPNITTRYFYGSSKHQGPAQAHKTIGTSILDLLRYIHSLPDSPSTLMVLIITTYTTWVHRSLYWQPGYLDEQLKKAGSRAEKQATRTGYEDDVIDDAEEKELEADELAAISSFCPGVFARVIGDESQKLRDTHTQTHISISLLEAPYVNLLTATPMLNKPSDLVGTLSLLWQPEDVKRMADSDGDNTKFTNPTLADYEEAKNALDQNKLSADSIGQFKWLLNPDSFRALSRPAAVGQQMDVLTANTILPPILSVFHMRRTFATVIPDVCGDDVRIGAQIPPAIWTTVELRPSGQEVQVYARVHRVAAPDLGAGVDEETLTGLRDMRQHRRLCHAVLNPALDAFYVRAQAASEQLETLFARGDHGASTFFEMTRPASYLPIYDTRPPLLHYISAMSSKLQWLLGLCKEVCIDSSRRLLIFVDWPMNQWLVEMFLHAAHFNVMGIRAAHKAQDREDAVAAFCDPESNVQILVTSLRISSTALNLQHMCCEAVFLDVACNAQTMIQGGGRIHRFGSIFVCRYWIVTLDHSYDQVLQATACLKMIGVIAGQANIKISEEERAERMAEGDMDGMPLNAEQAQSRLVDEKASDLYQKLFGQRSSRRYWDNVLDLGAKDQLVEEKAFRKELNLPGPPATLRGRRANQEQQPLDKTIYKADQAVSRQSKEEHRERVRLAEEQRKAAVKKNKDAQKQMLQKEKAEESAKKAEAKALRAKKIADKVAAAKAVAEGGEDTSMPDVGEESPPAGGQASPQLAISLAQAVPTHAAPGEDIAADKEDTSMRGVDDADSPSSSQGTSPPPTPSAPPTSKTAAAAATAKVREAMRSKEKTDAIAAAKAKVAAAKAVKKTATTEKPKAKASKAKGSKAKGPKAKLSEATVSESDVDMDRADEEDEEADDLAGSKAHHKTGARRKRSGEGRVLQDNAGSDENTDEANSDQSSALSDPPSSDDETERPMKRRKTGEKTVPRRSIGRSK